MGNLPLSGIEARARAYASVYALRLIDRLGSGKDGTVWATDARSALKVFGSASPFRRELAVYQRLGAHGVDEVCGHAVPQLLEHDERSDLPPHAVADQQEQLVDWFGPNLPKVAAIRAALARIGIHLVDVNPRNIAFAEPDSD